MLQVFAEAFVEQGGRLKEFQTTVRFGATGPVGPGDLETIITQLEAFLVSFENLKLATTQGIIRHYLDAFKNGPKPNYETAAACAQAIETALKSEYGARFFLSVNPELERYVRHPLRGWQAMKTPFPDVKVDIIQASFCLGLERPMAAVFHLMRVVEHGVRAIGLSLNQTMAVESMTWGEILKRCEDELAKKPAQRVGDWGMDEHYFRDVVLNLRSLQKAVRDPTMHVRKEYTVETAEQVYAASRAFMNHAAEKLHYP